MTTVPFDIKEANALVVEYRRKMDARIEYCFYPEEKAAYGRDEFGIRAYWLDGRTYGVRFLLPLSLTLAQMFAEAKDCFDDWSENNPPRNAA